MVLHTLMQHLPDCTTGHSFPFWWSALKGCNGVKEILCWRLPGLKMKLYSFNLKSIKSHVLINFMWLVPREKGMLFSYDPHNFVHFYLLITFSNSKIWNLNELILKKLSFRFKKDMFKRKIFELHEDKNTFVLQQ